MNMEYDLVIKSGTIVSAEATYQADIAIQGEQIAAIAQGLMGRRQIDATNKLITPGAVDVHVHMQMPIGDGIRSADDFFTGTRAAALGGTTTIIDFVDAKPEESLMDALESRWEEADGQAVIDYGLHMTLTPSDMDKLDQVPTVFEAGCASFKLYMAYGFRLKDGELLQALEAVRDVGGLPVVHAENWDVICTLVERNLATGRRGPRWHPRSRPAPLEGEAAGRAIDIATWVGTPLYIFHVSCAHVVERIADARRQGLPIYGETCPQYLVLTDALYDRPDVEGALPVCSPPLRTPDDQTRLWNAVAHNGLQVISTDHCPFTRAEKARGLDNYSLIPGGVPSIEARFPLIYSKGVSTGHFSVNRWVDLCCTTPARLFGLTHKGQITVGYDADLVIFDPTHQVTLSTQTLHEQVDWTPYEGMTLCGWPEMTMCRGQIVVEKGSFCGKAGDGRFVIRELTH